MDKSNGFKAGCLELNQAENEEHVYQQGILKQRLYRKCQRYFTIWDKSEPEVARNSAPSEKPIRL